MQSPVPVLENNTHKLRWDVDMHTDHQISVRRPDLIIINNNNKKRETAKLSTLLSRLTTEQNWKNVKRRISTSTLLGNWKKLWNMQVTIIPIVIGAFVTVTKKLLKGPGWLGGWRMSGDHPNDSVIENGQNTERSSRDLRIPAVTETPVEDHQLALMWKTLNE